MQNFIDLGIRFNIYSHNIRQMLKPLCKMGSKKRIDIRQLNVKSVKFKSSRFI